MEVTPRSIPLWVALEAVFLNIAGFFVDTKSNEVRVDYEKNGWKDGTLVR